MYETTLTQKTIDKDNMQHNSVQFGTVGSSLETKGKSLTNSRQWNIPRVASLKKTNYLNRPWLIKQKKSPDKDGSLLKSSRSKKEKGLYDHVSSRYKARPRKQLTRNQECQPNSADMSHEEPSPQELNVQRNDEKGDLLADGGLQQRDLHGFEETPDCRSEGSTTREKDTSLLENSSRGQLGFMT